MNSLIAMIPARMGSQRLKHKNLCELDGISLIARAVRNSLKLSEFEEVWVNSEDSRIGEIAKSEGAMFHQRPKELASHNATSEEYLYEFLKSHPCDYLFQIHTIAPLLSSTEISSFVNSMLDNDYDVQLSVVDEQIECVFDGTPINFAFDTKTNSQELRPVQRVTWSITGWHRATYIDAYEAGKCATYAGDVGFFPISRLAGHIIKTEDDLRIAEALLRVVQNDDEL